jgi:hypothetical protein
LDDGLFPSFDATYSDDLSHGCPIEEVL